MVDSHSNLRRKLTLVHETSPEAKKVKIAFATQDNEHVNQHFGSSTQFAIYYICPKAWQLVTIVTFEKSPKGHDQNKLDQRVNALNECCAVYCNAIGTSAIKQLLNLKIKPVKVEPTTDIKSVLNELKLQWCENENHWLANQSRLKSKLIEKSASQEKMTPEEVAKSEMAEAENRLTSLLDEEW